MDGQATEPAFDRQLALSRVGGDSELLREIAAIFLTDYPRSLGEVRAAIAAGDGKRLGASAHALKGSVANFGARAAVESASCLEQMGHAGDLRQSEDALHALEQALSALHVELEAL